MKLFIYKTLFAILCLYVLFEFTINAQIRKFESKIENLKSIYNSLVENYKDHNLSVDDGGLEKNSNSFSKYYYLPNFKNKDHCFAGAKVATLVFQPLHDGSLFCLWTSFKRDIG